MQMGNTIVIKMEDRGGATALVCPRCDTTNIHHSSVKVYDRAEDAASTVVTTVRDGCAGVAATESSKAGNLL